MYASRSRSRARREKNWSRSSFLVSRRAMSSKSRTQRAPQRRRHAVRARARQRAIEERSRATTAEPDPRNYEARDTGPGLRMGSPEQIRTAVTALRGRRPRPLDDGAVLTESYGSAGSGGRTRTPKGRIRTCCVANYTTPEWAAVSIAEGSQCSPSRIRGRRRGRLWSTVRSCERAPRVTARAIRLDRGAPPRRRAEAPRRAPRPPRTTTSSPCAA